MYIPNFILQVFFKLIWHFLTWLNLWPLLHLDPFVLKFYATIAEDHPDDLSPSATVKVQQLNFRSHFDCVQTQKYRGKDVAPWENGPQLEVIL